MFPISHAAFQRYEDLLRKTQNYQAYPVMAAPTLSNRQASNAGTSVQDDVKYSALYHDQKHARAAGHAAAGAAFRTRSPMDLADPTLDPRDDAVDTNFKHNEKKAEKKEVKNVSRNVDRTQVPMRRTSLPMNSPDDVMNTSLRKKGEDAKEKKLAYAATRAAAQIHARMQFANPPMDPRDDVVDTNFKKVEKTNKWKVGIKDEEETEVRRKRFQP